MNRKQEIERVISNLKRDGFQTDNEATEFNPMEFFADKVSTKEVVHTKILGILLSPEKSNTHHGMKHYFLKDFLLYSGLGNIKFNPDEVMVDTEYPVKIRIEDHSYKSGRIDILIRLIDESSGSRVAIIVENKLNDAKYQDKQLERYRRALQDTKVYQFIHIICLHRSMNKKSCPDLSEIKPLFLNPVALAQALEDAAKLSETNLISYIMAYARYLRNLHKINLPMDNAEILSQLSNEDLKIVRMMRDALTYVPEAWARKLCAELNASGPMMLEYVANIVINPGYPNYVDIIPFHNSTTAHDSGVKHPAKLSIGFNENRVQFYMLTDQTDEDELQKMMDITHFNFNEGWSKNGYWIRNEAQSKWWMDFNGKEDFKKVIEEIFLLITPIAKYNKQLIEG